MAKFLEKPFVPFLLLTALASLVYLPAYQAGYVTDFTGLVPRLEEQGPSGILTTYGFPALQPVLALLYYILYSLDGATGPFWFFTATILHGTNAFLVYRFCQRLLTSNSSILMAWLASLLFLLSPFQTEVVVWRVCFNYLLSTAAVLSSLHFALSYFKKGDRRYFLLACLCSFVGLLCFEQALVAPFITLALALSLGKYFLPKGIRLGLLQLSLVLLYFVLLKLSINEWVGHYGAETHFNFPLKDMIAAPSHHASKLTLLTRYWSHPIKAAFHGMLSQWYLSLPLLLLALLWIVYRFRKTEGPRVTPFFLLAFGLSLLPVLNLYFNFLLWVENDRYSYMASAFFWPFLVLALSYLPRKIFAGIMIIVLVSNVYFLQKTLRGWQDSSQIVWSLIKTYPKETDNPTLLLNLPDNLQGIPMFRAFKGPPVSFFSALKAFEGAPSQEVLEVMQYNMTDQDDGVNVIVNRPDSLSIEFNQWGNWWWRAGKGAGSYQTDQYRIREQGHRYRLILKDSSQQYRILYQVGKEWKEAK